MAQNELIESVAKPRTMQQAAVTLPGRFVPRFWTGADKRCAVVRTILQRYEALKQDAGGNESVQRDLLIQRAAFLSVILETQEVNASEGGSGFDLGVFTQACNALQDLLKTLGLERRVKHVGGDLGAYLAQKGRA